MDSFRHTPACEMYEKTVRKLSPRMVKLDSFGLQLYNIEICSIIEYYNVNLNRSF